MALRSAQKLVGRLTQPQYGLLKALTGEAAFDSASLAGAVRDAVADRLALARGLVSAASTLLRNEDVLVRRSAASRAYYAAYHAARAVVFEIHRRDEDDHEKLPRLIDEERPGQALGAIMKELRRVRNEMDYSPYPGPDLETRYDDDELEAVIRDSVERAAAFVETMIGYLRERR